MGHGAPTTFSILSVFSVSLSLSYLSVLCHLSLLSSLHPSLQAADRLQVVVTAGEKRVEELEEVLRSMSEQSAAAVDALERSHRQQLADAKDQVSSLTAELATQREQLLGSHRETERLRVGLNDVR